MILLTTAGTLPKRARSRADPFARLKDRAITYRVRMKPPACCWPAIACQRAGFCPASGHAIPAWLRSQTVTAYEDRPIHELLKAHLAPLNGCLAESPEQADLLLYLNAPAEGAAELQELMAGNSMQPLFQTRPVRIICTA